MDINIDNKILQESKILLNNNYKTPNFIDSKIYNKYKYVNIHGNEIKHIIIKNIELNNYKIETNFQLKIKKCV